MKIGFIGLGMMGGNAARNIRKAGFDMVVYDIRPAAIEKLLDKRVAAGKNPADVLQACDVVVTMASPMAAA